MRSETKQESSHLKLQQLKGGRKSSSGTTDGCLSPAWSAGSKGDESESHLNTSPCEVYDSCYICPLSVYIDVTVDDRLERLVVSGHPSREYLEEIRMKLVAEFSQLSSAGESDALAEAATAYYRQLCRITGLKTALQLVASGRFKRAIAYLNGNGVSCPPPESEDELTALLGKINLKLKNCQAKFKEISGRYKAMCGKGERPTRRYYNKLLIALSTCEAIKIQLNPKQMTVAEFAEYLNLLNEYRNLLKIRQNGGKH
jgi:hypothetical protein